MKKRAITLVGGALAAVAVYAQAAGTFQTTMQWNPYAGADGFIVYFGYMSNAPGVYFTNYPVIGTATTFTFTAGQPGVAYRSSIKAFSNDGRQSAPTPDIVWTNPPLLGPVVGYRPAAIIYVP